MFPKMRRVRARVSAIEWWRAVRYSGVSVVSILCTQVLLFGGHAVVGLDPMPANILAVSVAAVPAFLLSRRWVWKLSGPSSMRREVLPFWAFTLAGLLLSTAAVAAAAAVTSSSAAVSFANIGAFGTLWVAKYFVLDGVVFAPAAATMAEELVRI